MPEVEININGIAYNGLAAYYAHSTDWAFEVSLLMPLTVGTLVKFSASDNDCIISGTGIVEHTTMSELGSGMFYTLIRGTGLQVRNLK